MKPTEDLLKKILLNSIDPEGKKYWIKSINRTSPSSLEGITVQIASLEDDKVSNIKFGKYNLNIDGPLSQRVDEINENFYQILNDNDENFKQSYQVAKNYISRLTKELNKIVLSDMITLLENGKIVNEESLKISSNGLESKYWKGTSKSVGHEKIIESKANPYNTKDRKIKRGEIYFADLDPIYPKEIGGVRPVLVIAVTERNLVSVVPISSKVEYADVFINSIPLSFNDYPKLNFGNLDQDGIIVCTHALKIINSERLQEKITTIKEVDMKKVRDAIVESLCINEPIIDDKLPEILSNISQNSSSKKMIKNFPLSKDQVREILAAKFQAAKDGRSKLFFIPPKDVEIKFDDKGSPKYTAKGKCSTLNGQSLDYILKMDSFSATFKIGSDSEHIDDAQLRKPLAQTLLETYGEDYRQAYARHWVKTFCKKGKDHPITEYMCKSLNDHLADVGLKSDNPLNLLENGLKSYDYSMLRELSDDEQDN